VTPISAAAPKAAPGAKPAGLGEARGGQADDLKLIKGVGPKLETLLHSLGFFHFDQIANWTAEEIAWVDENLAGFKGRVTRDDWIVQAKVLAT
jgi:NADH-quinone oxidoreductase subunit E